MLPATQQQQAHSLWLKAVSCGRLFSHVSPCCTVTTAHHSQHPRVVQAMQSCGTLSLTATALLPACREYNGDVSKAWAPCAKIEVTSILGDVVTDSVCCQYGTCTGQAQLPCKSSLPSDDCQSAQQPAQVNVGGIGQAGPSSTQAGTNVAKEAVASGRTVAGAAAAALARFGRTDLAAARLPADYRDVSADRLPSGARLLQKGEQCGGKAFDCGKFGDGACADKKFPRTWCDKGLKCKRNDENWWGCKAQ